MKSKILIFLVVVILSGCGYTTGSLIPSHIKTIYVETFTNKTSEPGIEIEVTDAIKDRFLTDGALKIANSREEADSILKGEIIDYRREPLSYTSDNEVAEYRLVLTVNLTYYDLVKDEIMWEEEDFEADSEFYTTMQQQRFGSTNLDEEKLIENVARELAREIVNRTIEGW
ncbi:MAG: hypothetical protein DRP14_04035 [Candidatus Aenigmatarchaeota archaeon]|nr:MAG: hypothetical protein DRP14_04035 [Candidatus Aenigmarchaeota archaeon]